MAGMEFIVRQTGTSDRAIWAEMRTALWPDETLLTHAKMVHELLGDGDSLSLIAEATDGIAVGFAEIAIRKYAAVILGLSPFSKAFGSNRNSGGKVLEHG